jgi:hypothetical protein
VKRGAKPLGQGDDGGGASRPGFERHTRKETARQPGSRAQRWRDAVAEPVTLQDDYRAWLDSLPDNLAESATSEALRSSCDLDMEPPRGFECD